MLMVNDTDEPILLEWVDADGMEAGMTVGPGAEVWVDDTALFKDEAYAKLKEV